MEKFTKGKWVIYPSDQYVSVESEYGSHIYNRDVYQSTVVEQTANAHLIAAAPEMYAMIKMLIDGDSINDSSIEHECMTLLEKARGEHENNR